MSDHAFNCTDNDTLFSGPKPKPAPWRAGPVRKDLSRADRGELVILIKRARELIEQIERACIAQNDLALKSRLELYGEAISALAEVEGRMREALAKGAKNGADNKHRRVHRGSTPDA